jgi:PKD repeat protein
VPLIKTKYLIMKKLSILTLFSLLAANTILASTGRYRMLFNEDPSTQITLAWEQISGTDPVVHFGTEDFGTDASQYPLNQSPYRSTQYMGMSNQFAVLDNLTPNTAYFFVIEDSEGLSERFWFKTCPGTSDQPLSFISGGDSRSGQTQRINANIFVAKIRPHAVLFGGDLTNNPTNTSCQMWLDDWQYTITEDKQMIPIVHSFGNHEAYSDGGPSILNDLFDTPFDAYYKVTFGGDLFSVYSLNGELLPGHDIANDAKRQEQKAWLEQTIPGDTAIWKSAQYHRPMQPHNSTKQDGQDEFNDWAQTFYDNGVRLVMESDAHCVKVTQEVRPSAPTATLPVATGWFSTTEIAKDKGYTFIGEGSWGTLRGADKPQDITAATGSFYQVAWIIVTECQIMVRTIDTQDPDSFEAHSKNDLFTISPSLEALIWKPTELPTGIVNISRCNVPFASFDVDKKVVCQEEEILFADQSTNNPTTHAWDFGDGEVSSDQNPTHAYAQNGIYEVTLTASNNDGTDTRTITQMITIKSNPILVSEENVTVCDGEGVVLSVSGADSYDWDNGASLTDNYEVSPTDLTNYSVIGTTGGCSTEKTIEVTPTESPVVMAMNDTTICEGQEVQLTATGADEYIWDNNPQSGNNPTVTPSQSTKFFVQGVSNGCENMDSVLVLVSPSPEVLIDEFSNDYVCVTQGDIVLPTGTPAGGIYSGNGIVGDNFNTIIAGTGEHFITYTFQDNNDCEADASSRIFVSGCLDISEEEINLFSIYPNPASDYILIERDSPSEYTQIEILNTTGQVVYTKTVFDFPITIQIKDWARGTYFIRFADEKGKSTGKKVVIQ